MNIQEELRISNYQPVVGCRGTEEGEIFDTWIHQYGWQNMHFICSLAYNLGHVQGIRKERARRGRCCEMMYKKLSNEELQKFRYPNLIAELIESGYSICTCADHMGLGDRRQEDDPEVWGKLNGSIDMLGSEALGLSRLFGVKLEYLFADKLELFSGMPAAHLRWYEWNQKEEREYNERKMREEIERELREKPYLLDFMKAAVKWSEDELKRAISLLESMKTA